MAAHHDRCSFRLFLCIPSPRILLFIFFVSERRIRRAFAGRGVTCCDCHSVEGPSGSCPKCCIGFQIEISKRNVSPLWEGDVVSNGIFRNMKRTRCTRTARAARGRATQHVVGGAG
ncbi:hypothetical protein LY78DRAFT_391521 [Colletotrichum sublineola]|nr:hypothetical protein LY78DRAFT_391521 [Colletotrichum sublineola]